MLEAQKERRLLGHNRYYYGIYPCYISIVISYSHISHISFEKPQTTHQVCLPPINNERRM